MSLQSVRQFLADHAPDIEIIELNQSTSPKAMPAWIIRSLKALSAQKPVC